MARYCAITGKRTRTGNRVSHANNKTRRTWKPNLQWKRLWLPQEGRFKRVRISTSGLRTAQKIGVEKALKRKER